MPQKRTILINVSQCYAHQAQHPICRSFLGFAHCWIHIQLVSGFIRSFFVCLFITFFVLDLLPLFLSLLQGGGLFALLSRTLVWTIHL